MSLKFTVEHTGIFINGTFRDSSLRLPVISPVTEETVLEVCAATKEDVNEAVATARACFESDLWGISSTGTQRKEILSKIADIMESKKEYLAYLDHINMGKPMIEALVDASDSASYFRFYADLADKWDSPQDVTLPTDDFKSKVAKEPIGVIAAITPWNYPLMMASQKVAAAIAAGCTMVLKPSEHSPLSSLALAAICHEAGLPKGALNVIPGLPDVGATLVEHADVDKISFTGSEATGTKIMKEAANGVRGISLELGGKSPMIVFPDADLSTLIDWILIGITFNAGQVCSATSRLLIHSSIHKQVLDKLVESIAKIHVGPIPENHDGPHIGPIVCKRQYERVLGFIERAKAEGLTPLCGGSRPSGVEKGFFVQPTVFDNVPTDAEIWKEEVFGPVLSVRSFETEQEAIKLANETRFGLAASVMSSDSDTTARVSKKLRAGVVWVNCSQPTFVQAPWGGYKASGIGRELSHHGLDEFLEIKQITSCVPSNTFGWFVRP